MGFNVLQTDMVIECKGGTQPPEGVKRETFILKGQAFQN